MNINNYIGVDGKYYSCTNVLFLCTKKRLNIPGLRDTTGIYALVLYI